MPDTQPGQSFPLGATVLENGVNFCVFSKYATGVDLLFFDRHEDGIPTRTIRLDPKRNRTYYYWHVFVPDVKPGQLYGYRVHGPFDPSRGMRFDPSKLLIDPYTKAVAYGDNYERAAASRPGDNTAKAMKSVVIAPSQYDWEDDKPINRPFSETVIYEMHVGGLTKHPNSGVEPKKRGTYLGVIEKIPYLKSLGVTAVELLPIHQFDEQHAPKGLSNFWGYSTLAFFAPHRGYASCEKPMCVIDEFRDMVKALHQAGIEVILDVVFNHTAEGDHLGPTLSFRGFENIAYYFLESDNIHYQNFSGTGNALNANHSIVRRMIIDCLCYWVQEMHVDGFRFDLASVMSRDTFGNVMDDPPILWEIESHPVLAGTKMIAEAWDAAGLYQVGSFIGHRWAEWNGKYRDHVRRFVRSDTETVPELAAKLVASPDVYPQPDREPNRSINFITSHDGFTLYDLVSYNKKHNMANGENNRDGMNDNLSWNCGVEGKSDNFKIKKLRNRQMKNLMTILMMSQGTPMLLMGDEVARTKKGNNNTYAQDNELSWFDWDLVEINRGMLRFTQKLLEFTQNLQLLRAEKYLKFGDIPGVPKFDNDTNGDAVLTWHGVNLGEPDWKKDSHSLAFHVVHETKDEQIYAIFNSYWNTLRFQLPPLEIGLQWHRVIDTFLESPYDITSLGKAVPIREGIYLAQPRSVVVLVAM